MNREVILIIVLGIATGLGALVWWKNFEECRQVFSLLYCMTAGK